MRVADLAGRVQRGDATAEQTVRDALGRIDARNAELGAFLTVGHEVALERARALDAKRTRGIALGRLAGVPIGLKDALVTRAMPTTAGSKILCTRGTPESGWMSPYDATVVDRLEAEDAIIVGKCNMDEFAMGSSTEHSAFFVARNPHDPTRTAGGSSGGSAVAVASGMVPSALGSDTGGSIRQPAALTGIVGFKPTYGRVSRYGLIAFASSLDQIGTFGRSVEDAALVLSAISGRDARDATSLDAPAVLAPSAASGTDVSTLRVGVPAELLRDDAVGGIDPEVLASFRSAIEALRARGATVAPIELPHARYGVSAYYVIATAEASSNLSRFDGVRFGLRASDESLEQLYRSTRALGFGKEVKRRILLGTFVLSAGYYDAFYLRAQKVRTLIRKDFDAAFERVDFVATPTSPTVAFELGAKTADPLSMYLADVFTLPASLAGLPALSLPCGASRGLPIGLQLVGRGLADDALVRAALAVEDALGGRADAR
jgi:aspartyl-tRNA(Asn)/glutamyl-tRNA(Gln) amidotransferase subunit A